MFCLVINTRVHCAYACACKHLCWANIFVCRILDKKVCNLPSGIWASRSGKARILSSKKTPGQCSLPKPLTTMALQRESTVSCLRAHTGLGVKLKRNLFFHSLTIGHISIKWGSWPCYNYDLMVLNGINAGAHAKTMTLTCFLDHSRLSWVIQICNKGIYGSFSSQSEDREWKLKLSELQCARHVKKSYLNALI